MGCFSLRSLLLAAIIISNCITWTASRHSYPHNVSGHRRRHRRQGAGQYLPSSYVIPGGEGSEKGWGPWTDPTPCSRTCGGGVASQMRICLTQGSDANCTGGDTKYFSCNTQDCPGASDFRAEQCAEFNEKAFKSVHYSWIPYTNGPRKCELNCMPKGERFYYRQAAKVKDGTRCNDESFDVCVDGTCQKVGCDMMLGSDAREDKCRVCRGNGTNCYTNSDTIDKKDYTQGYTDILLIPEGAMNIVIEEIDKSNNYLALRSKNDGKYYLNGDYQISFPHTLHIAGSLWHYERSVQGFAAPDKLRSLGPINETLYLSLLTQEPNVGIRYEYSIPGDKSTPPTNQNYTWSHEEFSPCSVTCGTGFKFRNVTCRTSDELEIVDDSLCESGFKPIANETCQLAECMPEWVPSPWGPCSKLCGTGGSQSRSVQCQKIISNGYPSIVDENQCFRRLGDKPEEHQKCNVNVSCPTWFTGPWKPCDKLCGDGKQTRQVVCHRKTNGRVEVLVDESCEDEKPEEEQPCNIHPCDGIDWVVSNWTGCDSCLSKFYTREALCVTKDREVVEPELCSYHRKPELQKPCNETDLPACEAQWYATQWSNCSVDCGVGVKTRNVFCGFYDGGSVQKVDESKCDADAKYNDTTPCEVPAENCPARWYAATWSECTKECDGGEQFRKVMCLSGGNASASCPEADMPDEEQSCNLDACNIDELISVSSTTVMDDDDLPDCEEEDEEVGAELSTTPLFSSSDMMFSDASATPEGSGSTETEFDFSSFSTVTGSDIIEGSGETDLTTESSTGSSVSGSDLTEGTGSTSLAGSTDIGSLVSGSDTTVSGGATESTSPGSGTASTEAGESTTPGSTGETTTGGSTVSGASSSEGGSSTTPAGDSTTPSSGATDSSSTTSSGETGGTGTTVAEGATGSTLVSGSTTDATSGTTSSSDTGSTSSSTAAESATGSTPVSGSTTVVAVTSDSSPTSSSEPTATTTSEDTSPTSSTSESSDATTTPSESTTPSGETTTPGGATTHSGETTTPGGITTSSGETTTPGGITTSSGETTTPGGITTSSGETTTSGGSTPTSDGSSTTPGGEATTPGGTTVSGSDASTSPISTVTGDTASTTPSGLTGTTSSGSTESGGTSPSGSTEVGGTSPSGTTETSGSSLSTTESSTGSTVEGSSTTDGDTTTSDSTGSGSTTESGATETTTEAGTGSTDSSTGGSSTDGTTESGETTHWDLSTILSTKSPRCRPRNKPAKCTTSKFGCCPDKQTPAGGPFDEGCPSPTTCKDTKYGCCPDGVSAAGGPRNRDCPVPNCEETLYGCCKSDRKTAAEGNDQEGCPPACKFSKHGCCADNETQATGPQKEGCPETSTTESPTETTEVSTETGSTEETTTETTTEAVTEKCEIINGTEVCHPCSTTEFGCCDDGQTAAHGPNKLGCCLLSAHGCCPDNFQPAQGANLEGCDCKNSPFGCCPDQKSYATGANHTGCGCQHTTHGCCPDRHTEATGPNFEGCSCHTHQFGCCPDGVTAAIGFNLQGCRCEESKHGCCGDGVTPATGPNKEGCDCASSKYGCCPDGVTESQSKNFTGCAEALINKQAACALPYEQGNCTNYSIKWFYDMDYGGCSRFHYGGCGGNGNRFEDRAECESVCIKPAPRDQCHLPKVKGSCTNNITVRWYYDDNYQRCLQFHYGGCLGNKNRFDSQEDCEKQCSPKLDEEGQCQLPIEEGPCAGNYSRWGYNETTGRCEEFLWGGCQGNPNRFTSEAACVLRCNPPGKKKPVCDQPQDAGTCTEMNPYWSYSKKEDRCVPFYYGGCGGNENKFSTQEQCEDACPKSYKKDKCTLPASPGDCRTFQLRWFFDTKHQQCRQFPYGGCGGNANNFLSEDLCKLECSIPITPPPAVQEATCLQPTDEGGCSGSEERWTYSPESKECVPFTYTGCGGNANNFPSKEYCELTCRPPQDICEMPKEVGPCRAAHPRWYYDRDNRQCRQFYYGGCLGNKNNFETEEECRIGCVLTRVPPTPAPPQDVCSLSPEVGPCRAAHPRFYYNHAAGRCEEFTYGGCGGNQNNFQSAQECEQRCAPPVVPPRDIPPECRVASLDQCRGVGRVWYLEPTSGRCTPHDPQPGTPGCNLPGIFVSPEACERSCGDFRDIGNVCSLEKDAGPCSERQPKFYFDTATGSCQSFTYGGCYGSANRFSTEAECESVCLPDSPDPCKLRPSAGNCSEAIESWYYDEARDQCGEFYYTGCGGNDNRFASKEECEGRCKSGADPEPQCRTPDSLLPCGEPRIAFYYDHTADRCVQSEIGGCIYNPNNYRTEEECLRSCGAFKGYDVCREPLNPGPCRVSAQKFYWNLREGRCEPYTYGGCEGSANRFSNQAECEEVCGHLTIDPACGLAPAPGAACAGAAAVGEPRWHHSALYGDCRLFIYYGCGGNGNNFHTKEECQQHCSPPPAGNDPSVNEVTDCDAARAECAALHCDYGVNRARDSNGCDRCPAGQRCVVIVNYDATTGSAQYVGDCGVEEKPGTCPAVAEQDTSTCHVECNDDADCRGVQKCCSSGCSRLCQAPENAVPVPVDCSAEQARCASLQCELSVQKTRGPDGCEHCECVRPEPNCQPFVDECNALKCNYGPISRTTDADGCERCTCIAHPCEGKRCPEGQRCTVTASYDGPSGSTQYTGDCAIVDKPGTCPAEQSSSSTCHVECNDDADCRGVQKCCSSGCSRLCRAPAGPENAVQGPLVPQAPEPNPETEHEVSSSEGGTATLRCLFHSNPPPRITWRKGEITIDGNQGRYRLTSDGALQIISLYRDDSGVYICVAENELGVSQQEIELRVDGPVEAPAGIVGETESEVVGDIGHRLRVRCLAYGYPTPVIAWYHRPTGTMVPYDSAKYEARGNELLIKSLGLDTLGEYTCLVFNGLGKAVSWTVTVRADRADASWPDSPYLLQRGGAPPPPRTPAPAPPPPQSGERSPYIEIPAVPPQFTVPVRTSLRAQQTALATGGRLELSCDVDGHPEPRVYWTKDNAQLAESDRIYITPSRLSISRLVEEDAGTYGCHADNGHSSHHSVVQVTVQKLYIPELCKDNQYFADCKLIVRSKLCRHEYYSKFCCKSCVEARELDPQTLEFQSDSAWTFKKK